MKIVKEYKTQVLVVGAGLAGISAAMKAAESGSDVIVSTAAHFCSGSSFYPGTWGLGMIAPMDEADKDNLLKNIDEVGSGIADLKLSKVLVDQIGSRINELEEMGVKFKRPDNLEADNSLIPCFDTKHRKWYGYTFKSARPVFKNKISELKINVLEKTEIIKLIVKDNQFKAALGIDEENNLILIKAEAVVLASGGIGGLYQHSLNTSDLNGYGQVMAFEAGCKLTNVEFIQFIPGYLKPNYKTIFNERTFEYAVITDKNGDNILKKYLPAEVDEAEILKKRAAHGPFSSRLESKYVDFALFKEYLKNEDHNFYNLRYKEEIKNSDSLMIREYFEWLEKEKGITAADPISIVPFEHALNGGVLIDQNAATNVSGIYAAGEITGGMHGADRIGGLATANSLVFGKIAGQSASEYQKSKADNSYESEFLQLEIDNFIENVNFNVNEIESKIKNLRKIMWENASILRSEAGLVNSLDYLNKINMEIEANNRNIKIGLKSLEQLRKNIKLKNYLKLSEILLRAMLLRKESRGSHYREDFPTEDKNYRTNILINKNKNKIDYHFSKLNSEGGL